MHNEWQNCHIQGAVHTGQQFYASKTSVFGMFVFATIESWTNDREQHTNDESMIQNDESTFLNDNENQRITRWGVHDLSDHSMQLGTTFPEPEEKFSRNKTAMIKSAVIKISSRRNNKRRHNTGRCIDIGTYLDQSETYSICRFDQVRLEINYTNDPKPDSVNMEH